jgi:type IV secretory pathway TrbD component
MANQRRRHEVNDALVGHVLLWGCERLPLLLGWFLACAIVCPTGFQFLILDIIGLTWIPLWYAVCRAMARKDPRMTQKVLEHMRWADHVRVHAPMTGTPTRVVAIIAMFVRVLGRALSWS